MNPTENMQSRLQKNRGEFPFSIVVVRVPEPGTRRQNV